MKKIIIALTVILLACSCVTETGLYFDMRVSEPSYKTTSELVIEEPEEEPVITNDVPPMVGAMIVIRTDEEGSYIESDSSDAITTSVSTGADILTLPARFPSPTIEGDKGEDYILVTGPSDAPFLPPTTLEEETYSGRTRFLNRAVNPPRGSEDGRGSTLIVDPNYYIELGDDWDSSGWSDEPPRPTEPGTYRVYGW